MQAIATARTIETGLEAVVAGGAAVPPYAEQALSDFDVTYVG